MGWFVKKNERCAQAVWRRGVLAAVLFAVVFSSPDASAQDTPSPPSHPGYSDLPTIPGVVQPEILFAIPKGGTTALGSGEAQMQGEKPVRSDIPLILKQAAGQVSEERAFVEEKAVDSLSSVVKKEEVSIKKEEASDEQKGETGGGSQGEAEDDMVSLLDVRDVLSKLSSPDAPPLTISQIAKISDALKRAEYVASVEQKLNEMRLGGGRGVVPLGTSSSSASPFSSSSSSSLSDPYGGVGEPLPSGNAGGVSAGASVSVLRIVGSKGDYVAVLSADGKQIFAREGDVVAGLVIHRVSLNGVDVSTNGALGVKPLPFVAPPVIGGVSTARN